MNRLNISELRLTNFIQKNGEVISVTLSTFAELEGRYRRTYHAIPITEGWLVRFGFEFTEGYGWTIGDWQFCIKVDKGKFKVTHMFDDVDLRTVEFIHQLQNLYFSIENDELRTISNYDKYGC